MPNINLNKYHLFTSFGLFWVGLGWLGLVLALLGIFYISILAVYIFAGAAVLVYLISFNQGKIKVNHRFFLVFLLVTVAIFIFSYYTTPTIFSGRDQGSLSEAAIQLAQNHKLEFSSPATLEFFKIYGPGKALNFPGFNYTQTGTLITQFPLGYISWLAIFYSVFGLNGLIIANSVSLFLFLFSFYLVARYYLRSSSAITALVLILTSFVFSWFFKFTLSENLALALTWFGIFEFVLFTKNKERFFLLTSLLSFSLLSFARIEALAFLAVIVAILLLKYKDWKYLLFVVVGKKILIVLLGIILVYISNILVDSHSYVALIKGMLKPFSTFGQDMQNSTSFLSSSWYIFKAMWVYALFDYLLLGVIGFVYLFKHKKFEILVPFLIVLPSFIYLINPSISIDHPWMLRRFVFAVIPVSILYATWLLDSFLKKRIYFYIISVFLIALNLIVFIPFISFSPHKRLLAQIEKIGFNFSGSDLILVDREATGDGWSMMTGPLNIIYGKQAVYFFNPNDLAKINTKKFSNVYLVIPDSSLDFYLKNGLSDKITPVKDYVIENYILNGSAINKNEAYTTSTNLPQIKKLTIRGKIYQLKK